MKAKLLVVAAIGVAWLMSEAASADTLSLSNWPVTPDSRTPSGGIASVGEYVPFLSGVASFYGQSFTAPSSGVVYADQLTFAMEQYHAIGPVKYRILLVPGNASLSQVLFDSGPMVLPTNTTSWTDITVDLGQTELLGGSSYLWVIDTLTDRNGISGLANVGTKNDWPGGGFYYGGYTNGGSRSNFSLDKFGDNIDLAFQMDFTVTPLPAAIPLFASGLGVMSALGWRRKRKAPAA
jgi:hypothetical protein